MTKTALLVIDMQNDFMPGGSLEVPGGLEIVPNINRLMASDNFDLVVATKDWHPQNHGSFASNHEGSEIGEVGKLEGLDQIMWPDHCVQDTEGSEFVESLETDRIDHIIYKGTDPKVDSYSGFYDNSRRNSTGLTDLLQENNIGTVCLVGVATEYCVKFTALDAVKDGFETYLVEDCVEGVAQTKASDEELGDVFKALIEMKEKGVIITWSDAVLYES